MTPVVAGIGQTRFTRRADVTEAALAAQAIVAALRDAGVAPAEIDGVVRFDRAAVWEYDLPGVLAIPALHFYNAVPFGPGAAPALLRMAAMAVTEGLATTVLCHHARHGVLRPPVVPAVAAALVARRFGVGEREIAAVTVAHRRAAARNPKALVRRRLTLAARRRSPYVAEPLRRVDLAAPSVGACAFVVTSAARCRGTPVAILGSMQAVVPSAHQLPDWFAGAPLDRIARAARAMLRAARVRPSDVDVACVNADASALVPLALRAYGVAGGARVNPHGGQLCEAALDGVNDLVEAVRQLRGTAANPVRGARIALVAGSLLEPTSAVLLGRVGSA